MNRTLEKDVLEVCAGPSLTRGPYPARDFSNLPGRQMKGDFSNGPGPARTQTWKDL